MNRHAAILERLGGHKRVASLFGMRTNTVGKWRERGIPAHHWHRIIALSPDITPEYLQDTKPRGVQGRKQAAE